jgi:two-component system, LytTR family, sensor kinase
MRINSTIEDFFSDRRKLFWIFQFLFWFIHWLINYFISTANQEHVWLHTFNKLAGLLLSVLLSYMFNKYVWDKFRWGALIGVIFLYSVVTGLIWSLIGRLLQYFYMNTFYASRHFIWFTNYTNMLSLTWNYSYPLIMWSAMYIAFKLWEDWHNQKLQIEIQKTLVKNSQLEILKYQLKPHFLFNTLSTMRALVNTKPDQADKMITQVSELLRYSLLDGKNNKVPLSKEIEAIKLYLDIEKTRFENDLVVEFNINASTLDLMIPVFLVHPLVENAIKHGRKTSSLPLKISVTTSTADNYLEISVKNSGKWIDEDKQMEPTDNGAGLQNIRKRLEYTYPDSHSLDIIKGENFINVIIKIKLES